MLRVMLMSMPYTVLAMPSIAIAQLAAVARQSLSDGVQVDSIHAFLDFAEFVGLERYYAIEGAGKGLSQWLFRQAAFDEQDNTELYREFFLAPAKYPRHVRLFDDSLEQRRRVDAFLARLVERYALDSYDIVGFTSMMSQNVASFAMARRLKQLKPGIITIMGGPNCEHPMGKAIVGNVPQIDYVFSGEALVSFPLFLREVASGRLDELATIRGVHGKAQATTVHQDASTPGRVIPLIDRRAAACASELEVNSGDTYDLDRLPTLDYAEYQGRIDASPALAAFRHHLILPFQTSTGCWWADKIACSFCGLTPHGSRQMSANRAIEYINELINTYEGRFQVFEATDPCMPVEYPREVFPFVNEGRRVVLQYEVKAGMSMTDMKAMAEANVLLPQPGIESLSTKTLKLMHKGVSGLENVLFLKRCVEVGLYPIWNLLYGLPNPEYDELDTGKTLADMKALMHLPPPADALAVSFQRYSEYFNKAAEYGLVLTPPPSDYYVYPFEDSVVTDLVYTFVDPEYRKAFQAKHAATIRALNIEILTWRDRFQRDIPKLQFIGDCEILDSRGTETMRVPVTEREKQMLAFMDEPRSLSAIAGRFGISADETTGAVRRLRDRCFVFEDSGRLLSLVCEKCTLTQRDFDRYYTPFLTQASVGLQ
jgi:ribosomal peptide maturation radical SAM protein 1